MFRLFLCIYVFRNIFPSVRYIKANNETQQRIVKGSIREWKESDGSVANADVPNNTEQQDQAKQSNALLSMTLLEAEIPSYPFIEVGYMHIGRVTCVRAKQNTKLN